MVWLIDSQPQCWPRRGSLQQIGTDSVNFWRRASYGSIYHVTQTYKSANTHRAADRALYTCIYVSLALSLSLSFCLFFSLSLSFCLFTCICLVNNHYCLSSIGVCRKHLGLRGCIPTFWCLRDSFPSILSRCFSRAAIASNQQRSWQSHKLSDRS